MSALKPINLAANKIQGPLWNLFLNLEDSYVAVEWVDHRDVAFSLAPPISDPVQEQHTHHPRNYSTSCG